MKQKQVILVDGGKGGVGKSTTAAVLIDGLLSAGVRPRIIEADASVPDVGRRFKQHGLTVAVAPLTGKQTTQERVIQIFDRVFDGDDVVVMNLPAGAGEVLDQHADLLNEAALAADVELVHCWVVGNDIASAELGAASLHDGVAGIATRRVVVVNEHYGDIHGFPWYQHAARKAWFDSGAVEVVLPELPGMVREAAASSGYRDTLGSLSTLQRVALQRWLKHCDAIVAAVIGNAAVAA